MKETYNLYFNGEIYSVKTTYHARIRIEERNVNIDTIIQNINALGKETVLRLRENNDEAIIIDKESNTSVVLGFNHKTITIITVIGKSNVFVKSGTEIVNL